MSRSDRTLTCSRRSALAVGLTALLPGCADGGEQSNPRLQFSNRDSVAHSIHATFRGSQDEEPVQEFDLQLDPGAEHMLDERLELDRYEGSHLIVTTTIDDASPVEHSLEWGFSYLGAEIESDETVDFTKGRA